MSGRRFAILIASSRFPNEPALSPLRFPENDADGFSEVLRSEERGNFNDVVVLKNVSESEARHQIHRILKAAQKDDLVLIYYAGHGKLSSQGHLHLATKDTRNDLLESTSISMEDIKRLLDTSLSNKKVIILDSCYSGAAGDVFTRGGVDDQLQMMSKGYGTYIMTASTAIQTAIERTEDQHGIFTKHIIDGIKSGEADRDSDDFITMQELYDHVNEKVCAEACQEPMKWDLKVKGKLVIAKSGKTPKEDRRRQIFAKLLELGHHLPRHVLADAIRINESDISDENSGYVGLLEKLADNRLNAGEFALEWREISVEMPKKPDPPKPKIEPPVKPGKPPQNKTSSIEPEFVNSINMKFVYIQPGTFMMGSPEDEPGRYDNEILHKVTLTKGFYMQTTQVTQKQWQAVMGNNPSHFKHDENCPVECVSWDDTQDFIRKLNEKEGADKYRLPTEAEWEYTCRAGTTAPFYFGKCLSTDQANYDGNYPLEGCPKGQYREKTVPVGSFAPNAWGLYDMHGNVWEWCQDWYGDYPTGAVTDPIGAGDGSCRVLRGGGWFSSARLCRTAYRRSNSPGDRGNNGGFRLVFSS